MFLSELQNKEIISTKDGCSIGYIVDAKINDLGHIESLVIEPRKGFRMFRIAKEETEITFDKIIKIGEDVILVNM